MTEPTVEEMAREMSHCMWICGDTEPDVCDTHSECCKCVMSRYTPTEIRTKYAKMKGEVSE